MSKFDDMARIINHGKRAEVALLDHVVVFVTQSGNQAFRHYAEQALAEFEHHIVARARDLAEADLKAAEELLK